MVDWRQRAAPDLDGLAAMAQAALDALPAAFRAHCGDVVLQVAEFADRETLDALGCVSPFDLLGLYHGVDLATRGANGGGPAFVFLYRRPILEAWRAGEDTLERIISHVLVHEIGHHFGLSDADMEALEAAAERSS